GQAGCPKGTRVAGTRRLLPGGGTSGWGTIQCFPPKSPPYAVDDPGAFEPYGLGYIELPGEVRVEARLTEADPDRLRIGMAMELVVVPFGDRLTYAFAPVDGAGR